MRTRWVGLVITWLSGLVMMACASPSATLESQAGSPTVARAAEPVSTERIAEGYVRALYARDVGLMGALFPGSKPDNDRDEYRLRLVGLTVARISADEAGDRNPVSGNEYARVEAMVSAADKNGRYVYVISTYVRDGRRYIGSVVRQAHW